MRPALPRFFAVWGAIVTVGALVASVVMAAPPQGSITLPNNRHNMSSNATHGGIRADTPANGGTDQICVFCHTPHGAATEGPLWNRNAPTGTFSLYSGTLAIKGNLPGLPPLPAPQYGQDGTAPNTTQYTNTNPSIVYPNGSSRLCMSCHDGVTAINIVRNGGYIAMVANPALLDADGSLKGTVGGTGLDAPIGSIIDLSTSHPISFVYDSNVVTNIINPAYTAAGLPDRYQVPGITVDTPLDSQSRMQCTTCHDPHLDTSLVNLTLPPFWRQTSGATPYQDVCNNCHTTAEPARSPVIPVHP